MWIVEPVKVSQWGQRCFQGLYDPAKVNTDWPPLWLLITATALSFLYPSEGWSLTHSSPNVSSWTDRVGSVRWKMGNVDCSSCGNFISVIQKGAVSPGVEGARTSWGFLNCSKCFGCLIIMTFLRVISATLIKHAYIQMHESSAAFLSQASSHAFLCAASPQWALIAGK